MIADSLSIAPRLPQSLAGGLQICGQIVQAGADSVNFIRNVGEDRRQAARSVPVRNGMSQKLLRSKSLRLSFRGRLGLFGAPIFGSLGAGVFGSFGAGVFGSLGAGVFGSPGVDGGTTLGCIGQQFAKEPTDDERSIRRGGFI